MFPSGPDVQGAPLWVQIIVSLTFVFATGFAAWSGYRRRVEREPAGAASTLVASFPDMSAIRQLTDQCRILCEHIERLDATQRENVYHLRNKVEVEQDLCQRLRELRDEIVRSDRQRAAKG